MRKSDLLVVTIDILKFHRADLVVQPDVDLVVVLTSDEYHVDIAIQAADAGKHVLIEKPMALTKADGEAIIEARDRNNIIVAVGYMRRYAPAFLEGCKAVKSMKNIHYARVRDLIGPNSTFINQSGTFPKVFTDIPVASREDMKKRAATINDNALGEHGKNPRLAGVYRYMGGLSSHDLSAMREMLGMPQKVIGAGLNSTGKFLTVLFQYDGFICTFESGIDQVGVFDAHLEVYGGDQRIRVDFDTPFVKGLPTTLTIVGADRNGMHAERTIRPTYEDNFTIEYKELHNIITKGEKVKLTPEDALKDLVIFEQIIEALSRNV